jgi:hypothetical protein
MRRKWTMTLVLFAALALLSLPCESARAGVFISVGVPGPYYRPYYHHHYYYGPRLVVAAPPVVIGAPLPAPIYVQQPTVIYQQAPSLQPVPVPVPQTVPAPPPPVPVYPGR